MSILRSCDGWEHEQEFTRFYRQRITTLECEDDTYSAIQLFFHTCSSSVQLSPRASDIGRVVLLTLDTTMRAPERP